MSRSFTWPYPKNTDQLLQILVASAAAIMLTLLFFAHLTHSYQTRVITHKNIQGAAENLGSIASQADILAEQALAGRSTQSYQEALAYNLDREVSETLSFLQSHKATSQSQQHRNTLLTQGHTLRAVLHDISSKPTDATLKLDRYNLKSVMSTTEHLQQ